MKKRTLLIALSVMALLVPLIAGCSPSVVKETVIVEKPVEKVVVETVVVDKAVVVEKVVTATPLPPTAVPPVPTIRMYFVPSIEVDQVLTSGDVIADLLTELTGYEFEIAVPTSYAAVIEAICSGKADVAWLASLAYVLANNKCGAVPILQAERFGSYTYQSQILVQADAVREAQGLEPITSIDDLNGKTFAFTDPASTSGFLFPKVMLVEAGIALGEEIFAGGHTQSVLAVYKGDVDASASYWDKLRPDGSIGDARLRLIEDYPDVTDKVKILALSSPIPNDTVSVRKDLDPEVARTIQQALMDIVKIEEGLQELGDMYNITGFIPGDDARYEPVRVAGVTLGYDFLEKALE